MLPGARQALRRVDQDTNVVTSVSRYTRRSTHPPHEADDHTETACSPDINADRFRPDAGARAPRAPPTRTQRLAQVHRLPFRVVARKGQDVLVRALPDCRARIPGARLLLPWAPNLTPDELRALTTACEHHAPRI